MTKEYSDLKWYLRFLCAYHAENVRMGEAIAKGEPVNTRRVAFCSLMLTSCKRMYLNAKENMGYGGGLNFLFDTTNAHLLGFVIENGQLVEGEKKTIYAATEKFISGYPDDFSIYKWEVGNLARALSDPDYMEDRLLYPYEYEDKGKKKMSFPSRKEKGSFAEKLSRFFHRAA